MREFIVNELKASNIITPKGQVNKQASRLLNNKFHGLLRSLITQTSFLPIDSSVRLRIVCLQKGITERGKCKVCGDNTNFDFKNGKFFTYCANKKGQSCASHDQDLQNQRETTIKERYGVDNVLKNQNIREKIKHTNYKKYGGPSPMHSEEIKNKRLNTIKNKKSD